jgi:hypothetical protein
MGRGAVFTKPEQMNPTGRAGYEYPALPFFFMETRDLFVVTWRSADENSW